MREFALTQNEKADLERLGVAALVLFGSHAQGIAGSHSDVDVGILMRDPRVLADRQSRHQLYDALYDVLSAVSGRTLRHLCNIDIVFLQDETVNLQLKYHVTKYGIPLYEKEPRSFANFKEYVMERYADFAPLRRVFTEAILAKI